MSPEPVRSRSKRALEPSGAVLLLQLLAPLILAVGLALLAVEGPPVLSRRRGLRGLRQEQPLA